METVDFMLRKSSRNDYENSITLVLLTKPITYVMVMHTDLPNEAINVNNPRMK